MDSNHRYVKTILKRLSEKYGRNPHTQLQHTDLTNLFVAVFLSPQNTDLQVNKVTPRLFKKFKTIKDYADANTRVLRSYLKSLNFYKTKARNLQRSSRLILDKFNGEIPKGISELMELPGVGRKVANVILNEGYQINEGIAVDTHCGRVARRLHLSRHKEPEKIEQDLLKKVPKSDWGRTSNLLIELGRDACKAKDKQCYRCVLNNICPSSSVRKSN